MRWLRARFCSCCVPMDTSRAGSVWGVALIKHLLQMKFEANFSSYWYLHLHFFNSWLYLPVLYIIIPMCLILQGDRVSCISLKQYLWLENYFQFNSHHRWGSCYQRTEWKRRKKLQKFIARINVIGYIHGMLIFRPF